MGLAERFVGIDRGGSAGFEARRGTAAQKFRNDLDADVDQAADARQEDDDVDPGKDVAATDRVHNANRDHGERNKRERILQIDQRIEQG